jgi:Protein of unknown function (DUF3224)
MNPERRHATGKITVRTYEPTPYDQPAEGPALSRIHVEEEFSGDIEGTGVVEFLQAQVSEGAASFVGLERLSGSVGGRAGTFLLQDQGTLRGTTVSGDWFVVPSSARAPRSRSTTGSSSGDRPSRRGTRSVATRSRRHQQRRSLGASRTDANADVGVFGSAPRKERRSPRGRPSPAPLLLCGLSERAARVYHAAAPDEPRALADLGSPSGGRPFGLIGAAVA